MLFERQGKGVFGLLLTWGLVMVLTACSGDLGPTGSDGPPGSVGPPGEPGPPGPGAAGPVPTALEVTILDAVIDSEEGARPALEFLVLDQDGYPFTGLTQASFAIAKLVPGSGGETDAWQSYINRVQQPGTGDWPGTEPAIQATLESSASGTLDNVGDGRYRYTFATDLDAVTSPLALDYDAELTHRIGLQVGGSFRGEPLPAANAVYTFQPATGLTADQGIHNRKLTDQAACATCHGNDLVAHGARVDVDYCVICHNPGTTDAQSGHSMDFRVLMHKVHMGQNLPSVQAGEDYIVWGFQNRPYNYSGVAFPQDPRNCLTCHNPDNAATPQAINALTKPTIQACGSCHDNIDFIAGEGHPVTDNTECSICHRPGGFAGDVLDSHIIPAQHAAQRFWFNILDVTNTGPGESPTVTFSVTDPTDDNSPYQVLSHPAFGAGAALTLRFGWDNRDYSHGPGAGLSVTNLHQNATDNEDGTYTITAAGAIPASVSGSGVVGMEGRAIDPDGGFQIPVTGSVAYFAITDDEPVARRQVITTEQCQACHSRNDALAFHGNQRTDEVQLCLVCHTASTTDIARRGGGTMVDGVSELDHLAEQSVHFKYMIHAIHGASVRDKPYVAYGFGNNPHDFSGVRYPRSPGDCLACHTDSGYQLPLPSGVLGTSVITAGSPSVPGEHLRMSEATAACGSCHTGDLARAHMLHNGGVFDQPQAVIDASVVETCSVCHGPGQIADVKRVHGL